MQLYRLRKADRLADYPCETHPQRQRLALHVLRVSLPHRVLLGLHMPCVGPPAVGARACDAKRLQQHLALPKDRIFPTAKDRRQDDSCMMIDGMPPPALVAFRTNTAPHLVHLSCPSLLHVHEALVCV